MPINARTGADPGIQYSGSSVHRGGAVLGALSQARKTERCQFQCFSHVHCTLTHPDAAETLDYDRTAHIISRTSLVKRGMGMAAFPFWSPFIYPSRIKRLRVVTWFHSVSYHIKLHCTVSYVVLVSLLASRTDATSYDTAQSHRRQILHVAFRWMLCCLFFNSNIFYVPYPNFISKQGTSSVEV